MEDGNFLWPGPRIEAKPRPSVRAGRATRRVEGGEYLAGSFLSAARPAASAKIRLH